MADVHDPNELGALWVKTSPRGDYMTGTINGEKIVVFKNENKGASGKGPDWRVFKPKAKDAPAPTVDADERIPF